MRIIIDIDVKGAALEDESFGEELRFILDKAFEFLMRDDLKERSRWLMDSNGNSVGRVVIEESAEE